MTMNWVVAGLSQDLPAGVAMAAVRQGQDLAVWRSASGRLSAWADRCPHRGMRLSHGFVRGETLACIYHGWVFGSDGGCRRIPAHPDLVPPASIRAESLLARDQHGLIWVGVAEGAEDIPDLSGDLPLRSLTVEATPAAVAAALPGFDGSTTLRGTVDLGGHRAGLTLVLHGLPGGQTVLHALIADQAEAVALSRWLEAWRMTMEEGAAA